MVKPNTLICTVGTSLLTNLKNLERNEKDRPDNWETLLEAYKVRNYQAICHGLRSLHPSERVNGAEINSIYELQKRSDLRVERIFFLISDTEDGEFTGKILKSYYRYARLDCEVTRVENLQDERPEEFSSKGLRNLVRKAGSIIGRIGREYAVFNATGGYKAQIAIAVVMGQTLDIPVYYKHERFTHIVRIPPLPVIFNYDILGQYSDLFSDLEESNGILNESQVGELDERIRVLLDETVIDGKPYYTLSPIGEIFLTTFRLNERPNLRNALPSERTEPKFPDHHYPSGFREWVLRIWRETPWITTAASISYDGQRGIKPCRFRVVKTDGGARLIGDYRKGGFGARAQFCLTDNSLNNLNWAADYMNQTFGKN